MLFIVQAKAQTYPITGINISLPANPDANMANWGTGVSQFTITANGKAVNGRVDGFVAESKILVIIKKDGKKICGIYTSNTAPATNFNTLTKVWSGSNAVSLIGQSIILPPGDYELSVQFFGYSNAKFNPLSDEKTKAFTIRGSEQQSYQAPQAIAPTNETLIKESDLLKPITFRWTPIIPRPAEPTTYRLRVWQLMQGQNAIQAIKVNQPIITKDVDNLTQTILSNLYTGPCKPPYLCNFVWNVQALNRDGKPIGSNNGTSESFTFSFSSTDKKPPMITLLSPVNGNSFAPLRPAEFKWKINVAVGDLNGDGYYKIKIVEIIGDQSPEQAFRTNKPIFERDSLEEFSFHYPPSAPALKSGKKYVWAIGSSNNWSSPSMFQVGTCDVNLSLKLRSIACLPDVGRTKRYKINFSSTYTSSTYNLTYAQTGSGLTAYHPSYSPSYSVTNISPALLSQNSGASTTVNYSFDVSVPIGQTAIKIGLQGDDKDPGPITCKPGAELDITLPVCAVPVCDCGKWGPLVLDGEKYDCGSRINWSCKKPFQFTSSYQCSTTDKDCVAKTTWEVKKEETLIKSGTGTNTLSDGVSLLTNGIYTLTLNANCGDKKCPPCTYTIIIEDCKAVPACDCGEWGSFNVKIVNAAGSVNRAYKCGESLAWKCNQAFSFSSSYLCSQTVTKCQANTSWEVKKDGVVIKTGTGTNSAADTFTPTSNGVYTITLNADCGDKRCSPCTFTIKVDDCKPVLSCIMPPKGMVAWWTFDEKTGQALVDRAGVNNAGIGVNNPLSLPAKVAGGLEFNGINNHVTVPNHAELNFGTGDFSFDAWIQTSDATIIKPIIDKRSLSIGYAFFLYKGKLSLQLNDSGPNTNYVSSLFVADGRWHHIAVTVARKDKKGIIFYLDGMPTQLGDPTLRPGNLDNTEPLLIARNANDEDNNGNKIHFKGILDEIELFNRVVSPIEVQNLYTAGSSGKCKTKP